MLRDTKKAQTIRIETNTYHARLFSAHHKLFINNHQQQKNNKEYLKPTNKSRLLLNQKTPTRHRRQPHKILGSAKWSLNVQNILL